jgi:XapX domain-containing protein
METARDLILALVTGTIMGGIFSLMRLPVPAPQSLAGVVGILGIFLGYLLVKMFVK